MDGPETRIVQVLARYGAGEVLSCSPVRGTRNMNLAVETPRGRFFLRRRYSGYSARDWVEFDHAAMDYLARRGAPMVPLLETSDGEDCVVVDGEIWELFKFVESDPLPEDATAIGREVARALAQFHRAGEDFKLRCEKRGPWGELTPAQMRRAAGQTLAVAPEARAALEFYLAQINLAEKRLGPIYDGLPATLCHGDVHPANLLLKGGRVILTDLDWMGWRTRLYDVCWGLAFFGARRKERPAGESIWNLTQPFEFARDCMGEFLRTYESDYFPLSETERAALPDMIRLMWCHGRVDGALKVPADKRAQFLGRDLRGPFDWLDANPIP